MNAVALADALPWGDATVRGGRTILITDSAGTDGRFLLHMLAAQTLASRSRLAPTSAAGSPDAGASPTPPTAGIGRRQGAAAASGRVLWLGCTSASEGQIASALKKVGCDASVVSTAALGRAHAQRSPGRSQRMEVIPVASDLASKLLASEGEEEIDLVALLKDLYRRVASWMREEDGGGPTLDRLVVVDDASSLSTLFGERPTEFFIRQLRSAVRGGRGLDGRGGGCLAVLCSNDADQDRHLSQSAAAAGTHEVNVTGTRGAWVGAAGDASAEEGARSVLSAPPWERALVEIADGIIDVVPLQSGFSLEAHGRLVFTERRGGLGWTDRGQRGAEGGGKGAGTRAKSSTTAASGFLTTVVNYCCEENSVKAFRLRATS